jgi:hypothetical protein
MAASLDGLNRSFKPHLDGAPENSELSRAPAPVSSRHNAALVTR